ncbi:unnamed protein product [Closterium sp. NIES-53]
MRSLRIAQDSTGTVRRLEDLVSHLRTSDARYCASVPTEFLQRNQPPMFITLYFIVTRLPDSLHSVRDHFLSLDPTSLTVDLLEQHLLTAETSAVPVGVARGTPRPPFFEGCSPSPLAPSYASAAAADVPVDEDVGVASARVKRRSSKGKGGRDGRGGSGSGGRGSNGGGGGSGGGGGGGTGGGGGGSGGGGGGSGGRGGSGGGGTGGGRTGARHGWLFQRGTSWGSDSCPFVIRTGDRAGQTCGRLHTQHRYFFRLDDAWRAEFGDEVERPRWAGLLRFGVAIFDLDFDVILSAMHALSVSAEGDCYRCVPPDPGIAAVALGATESGYRPGTVPAKALHTFTLDSSASRCFFRDSTTLTPLSAPVPVRLADPSGSPVVARSSTVLPCPAVPSGSLSGLHLPSFSTNLVSTAALQDSMVTTTTPGGQRVSICMCTRTDRHLATFTHRPGSSPYTLATESPQVAASAQVSSSGQVAPPCSCRLLSHQTLLWHHRLGHPSLPRLRGMHSRLLVSGLPMSLPPLPPSPAPPCLPCIERWQRATPHSSSFPPTTSPLQTLHMDVTFLSFVCTLRGGELSSDLLRDFCRGEGITQSFTLPASPRQNGIAERRIGLVMEFARTSMIHAAAPHFLYVCCLVGDALVFRVWGSHAFVRDTSADKLSARAIPCVFLGFVPDAPGWQFYHPTSRRVFTSQDVTFDESIPFYRLFLYRSTPPPPQTLLLAPGPPLVDPLPPQGPAPSGVSQVDPLPGLAPVEVSFGLGAARGAASGGAASGGAELGGAESKGFGSGGAEPGGEEPGGPEPEVVEPGGDESEQLREWLIRRARLWIGATRAGSAGDAGAGGAGVTARAGGTGGATVAGPGGAPTRGTRAAGTGGVGGAGAGDPTEPGAAGAGGSGAGGVGAGGAGAVGTGAGGAGAGGAGVGGTGAGGAGVGGTSAGGAGAGGAGAVDPGGTLRPRPYFVPLLQQVLGVPSSTSLTPPLLCPPPDWSQLPLPSASPLPASSPHTKQSGGLTERREPASRPIFPFHTARCGPRSQPPPLPGMHAVALRPSSVPLRVPLESSLPVVLDPESDRAHATNPTVSRLLATAVNDPSFEPAAASVLVTEPLDFAAACRLDSATALITESATASPSSVGGEYALDTDVLEDRQEDFECLAAAVPRFASMLLAPEGDPDAPDIPTPRSYAEAITGPYSSQWQAAMDAEMASWKSTGTYVDEVPPPGANIVDGMWIFRVKRPPGSPPAFKARYVARGFSQRQGVDYFHAFSSTPKMTTLRVLLHVAAQRDYELHSLDVSTAFLQGSLHKEIWLRRPPGFTVSFPAGTQWSLRRPVYGLCQAPREWHDTLRTTPAALGFAPATADPSLFLRTDTSLPPFYVIVYVLQRFGFQLSSPQPTPPSTSYSLSAPPSDESVEPSGPYPELVGCLMYLMTCTRPGLAYPLSLVARYVAPGRHRKVHWDAVKRVLRYLCSTSDMGLVLGGRGPVVLTGHVDASWVDDSATQRLSQGYTFSLRSGSVSWWSTHSSSVLGSSCEAEIHAGAMAAQELHWLTYLLTDLGEQPRLPPVLYVDNKAMIALCQEHRLEHRTKHIALRYFLARELQQRGQLRLTYVATRANTADIFTKALPPSDHQRFATVLGLVPTLPHLFTA